jgi:pyrroloquinoline-quinone synthase
MLELERALDQLHLLKHPFYYAWNTGQLSKVDLQIYSKQYFHHVDAFPRYISAAHSNCTNLQDRQVLLENLKDEEAYPDNHPALWLRFTQCLGLSEAEVRQTELFPETQQLINEFLTLTRSSYAEGLGALHAYERQVPQIASSKIAGLKKFYGIDNPKDILFFTLHMHADVEHAKATAGLLKKLSAEEKILAKKAAKKIALALWDMLTGIQMRTIGAVNGEAMQEVLH